MFDLILANHISSNIILMHISMEPFFPYLFLDLSDLSVSNMAFFATCNPASSSGLLAVQEHCWICLTAREIFRSRSRVNRVPTRCLCTGASASTVAGEGVESVSSGWDFMIFMGYQIFPCIFSRKKTARNIPTCFRLPVVYCAERKNGQMEIDRHGNI